MAKPLATAGPRLSLLQDDAFQQVHRQRFMGRQVIKFESVNLYGTSLTWKGPGALFPSGPPQTAGSNLLSFGPVLV